METLLKSSWFWLLLGSSLLAAALQDPEAECPSPDKVSCTAGIKCNVNEDCDKENICCANSCYTKRCITISRGVQDAIESEGPTEKECRPYIEKALKELSETGEAATADSAEKEDSVEQEDVPTVEITTDDSDANESEEGDADELPPTEKTDELSEQSTEDADAQATAQSDEKLEENEESLEDQTQPEGQSAEEQSKENEAEEAQQSEEATEAEIESKEEEAAAEEPEPSKESVEEIQAAPAPISEEVSVEQVLGGSIHDDQHESVEEEQGEASEQQEDASEQQQEEAAEQQQESAQQESAEQQQDAEDQQESISVTEAPTEVCPPKSEVPCAEGNKCNSDSDCRRNFVCCPNKCYRNVCIKGPEASEDDTESTEDEATQSTETTTNISEESEDEGPTVGCPRPDTVSCVGGTLCNSHASCQENEICCLNKCYRKRCVEGELPPGEERGEPSAEEPAASEEKVEKGESVASSEVSGGCPPKSQVSCSKGNRCNKHSHCEANEICCPNNCYGRRCIEGELASGEERGSESEEDEAQVAAEKTVSTQPQDKSGCPPSNTISCQHADLCGKHADCENNEICCPNKCYRKSCVEGELASGEERGEKSEEEASIDKRDLRDKDDKSEEQKTGCPSSNNIACNAGPTCSKHADCDSDSICCPNKCYRKNCVEGSLAEGEERGEVSEEESEKPSEKISPETTGIGCPASNSIACGSGPICAKHKECADNEICCPNKCYRKQCVEGELASGEREAEESSEESISPPPVKVPKAVPVVPKIIPKKEVVEERIKPVQKIVSPQKEPIKPPTFVPPKEIEIEVSEEESTEKEESHIEELTSDDEEPVELRSREHVEQLLKLDDSSSEKEQVINTVAEVTLKELKRLYENAIKPLEVLYKYRDLSNRHFGDAEIFSKPLILFMGPWSGGKSSIINYLTNNEYNDTSLRTGAEPSPAYFNILMYGEEPEVIDGTQLAADFTFSGLQKFGQGLEERLRGLKLPSKLLQKVNIVEIPGILEVRKQVSRVFPFNDACQWFIDRADIIFLVYDPSKLDVGPETEAILDQLKGREHQTRIVLNKADQVKPEELMRVQGALIWNISPLMSSPQPPVMYTTSLWSKPYEPWAPAKLLQAQERAFLRDFRSAVDKRIENKIASARRFAVRVRNHAKMVDCYLTTYYNHKTVFGNRKQVADEIVDRPQDYHIYEGLSTLTNISRYDLPDPDVYKDFFKLNPLYDFQQLSATCTYFRGCPINRLDVAIAYDLPELVGSHKRLAEAALSKRNQPAEPAREPKTGGKPKPAS